MIREEFKIFKSKIPDAHKKLDKIERLAVSCNPNIIDGIIEINNFLFENRKFKDSREYILIATDANIIKTDIIDHCICQ